MNIMMSLMQLDIGGAETHVVELAKELKRRGHNIIVTSNGGAYEPELEKSGIKHFTVPLNTKKPKEVMTAFARLREIITEEKIDMVHAHARIPGFILGKLHKKMNFPFVTTAHGVFTTKYGLKYITDWGQKTLAVSEDIKTYLMDNYKIPEGDITVTVNGIDTARFTPKKPSEKIIKEFDIKDSDNVIVHVSRLNDDCSLAAYSLIESAKALYPIIEDLKCIIVGTGTEFDSLKAKADEVNKAAGKTVVYLTGARTDVDEIIAAAKLFVGVSRAALEAMAEEKPTILFGISGYMGLFEKDKLESALSNNFCCRGEAAGNSEMLTQDIGNFFGMWEQEQKEVGVFSREVVLNNYSVQRMADDAEKVYKEVTM